MYSRDTLKHEQRGARLPAHAAHPGDGAAYAQYK